MSFLAQTLAVCASYLVGSIPFGLLISRLFSDVDVRSVGSGNIGATNVLRAAGKKAAVLTLIADCLKGLLPVLTVQFLFQHDTVTALCGAAAVLGHNFPLYLRFKGGKGVATGYGVILGVTPWVGLACLLAWIIAAAIWRFSSLSALLSYAVYPAMTIPFGNNPRSFGMLSLFLSALIYYRHRENIMRLLAGTEPKIGKK
jgi:glycerol-3-phosphate acyltransferase PlsY